MTLQASIVPEGSGFVARCLEIDIASQGDPADEALHILKEALALYFEGEAPRTIQPALVRTVEVLAS